MARLNIARVREYTYKEAVTKIKLARSGSG